MGTSTEVVRGSQNGIIQSFVGDRARVVCDMMSQAFAGELIPARIVKSIDRVDCRLVA